MRRPGRHIKLLLALLAVLLAAALFDGWRLLQIRAWNRAMADGSILAASTPLPPEALFAKAYLLERRGDYQTALELYRQAGATADPALRIAAEYNSANIYLRQGHELQRAGATLRALPLIELAKEAYRTVLRNDSQHWDAKYNLERALRLVPDPEEEELVISPPPRNREHAPGTVRAFDFGLP